MVCKIKTKNAPSAIGPYSQAIQDGNLLFISGQIPLSDDGELVGNGDIKQQTRQVIKNIMAIIQASDFTIDQVIKCTCYLIDMDDFQTFNEVYSEFFGDIEPARECVAVAALPKGAKVEISAVCVAQ